MGSTTADILFDDAGLYNGQEIDIDQDHIRLLDLHPSSSSSSNSDPSSSSPLTCTSRIVNLSSSPSYIALSYVWGDPSDCLPITFNSKPNVPITRNLHAALLHLRHPTDTITLWVDALCINQSHAHEKPHQIQLMGEIYKSASETCIWVGEGSATSDLAIEVLRNLDGEDLNSPRNSPDAEGLQAIAEFQKRPWFSRVWVIQEALLSQNPTIHCGDQTLEMEKLMVLDDIRRDYHRPTQTYQHGVSNTISTFSAALRNSFSFILTYWPDARTRLLTPSDQTNPNPNPSRLAEWAEYLSHFQATDPRDKIYGLLGLGSQADRNVMQYALENGFKTSQVYTRAMMWFLMCDQHLLQLSFDVDYRAGCPMGEEGEGRTLPSWVVDFSENIPEEDGEEEAGEEEGAKGGEEGGGETRKKERWRPGYVNLVTGGEFVATGDGRILKDRIEGYHMFPFSEKILALRVRGLVVDRVVYAGRNKHLRLEASVDEEARMRYSLERIRTTAESVREWEREVMREGREDPYGGEEGLDGRSRREVFRRALVGDRDHERRVVDWNEEWDEMFDVLMARKKAISVNMEEMGDKERLQYLLRIRMALIAKTSGRSFIITEKGYFGLAPIKTRIGDEVCVLEGGSVPFVLRAVDDSDMKGHDVMLTERQRFFYLVGESYVHGVSDGKWIERQKEEDVIEAVLV